MNFRYLIFMILMLPLLALASPSRILDGQLITNGSATLTLPTSTDTLVGRNTSDSLQNKTISGSLNTITNISLTSSVTGVLPIVNGGTGQSTLSGSYNALSPASAKGDVVVHNGTTNVALPVGSDGQFLIADSTQSTGIKWGAILGHASNTLNNLVATLINQDLVFDKASPAVKSGDKLSSTNSESLSLKSGNVVDGISGDVIVDAGQATGSGSSGLVKLGGNAASVRTLVNLLPNTAGTLNVGTTANYFAGVAAGKLNIVDPASGNVFDINTPNLSGKGSFSWYLPDVNGLNGQVLKTDGAGHLTWVNQASGSGTVTSVGLSAASLLSISGSPITTSGTIDLSFNSVSANMVLSGPSTGSPATPAFRSLVSNDIPSLDASKITTGKGSLSTTTSGVTIGSGSNSLFSSATIDIQTATSSQPGLLSASDWMTFNSKLDSFATTAPLTLVSGTLGIDQSGAVQSGYLSSSDWNTFNNKQPAFTEASPLSLTSGTLAISQSSAGTDGYLSSTDWSTFNSKQPAFTEASPLSLTSGTLSIAQAGSGSDGYLSSTDWNTFNGKGSGSVTSISAGTGLAGGPITTSGSLYLADTAISPGTYSLATITVDQKGRLTSASSGSVAVGANTTLSNLGTTAINAGLFPDTNSAYDIGSSSAIFQRVFGQVFRYGSLGYINFGTGAITDNSLNESLNIGTRILKDSAGNPNLDWSSPGIINAKSGTIRLYGTNATNYVGIKANNSTVSNTTYSLPIADGSSGQFLTTSGSGSLSWSSPTAGANTSLSNLSSTAVNTDLFPAGSGAQDFGSVSNKWNAGWFNGQVTAGSYRIPSNVNITSSVVAPTGQSTTGMYQSSDGTSIAVFSADSSGNNSTPTGALYLETGSKTSVSSTGPSGNILIQTGNSFAGASGEITLKTGTAGGTRGHLQFQDGSEGTSGYVWTSTDTTGKGHWAAAAATGVTNIASGNGLYGGPITSTGTLSVLADSSFAFTSGTLGLSLTGVSSGTYTTADVTVDNFGRITSISNGTIATGANTTLSNLGTTAINTNLIPDNTWDIGSNNHPWSSLFLTGGVRSVGQDLYLESHSSNFSPDTTGRNVNVFADSDGLTTDVNGGKVRLKTANATGTGNSGNIEFTVGSAGGTRGSIIADALSLNLKTQMPLRFYDSSNTNYAGFKASSTTTASVDYILPPADGSSGQVLKTDGAGNLSWVAQSSNAPNNVGSTGSPQNITAAGGIAFTGTNYVNNWFIQGNGGAVTVTANPQIAAGTSVGQTLILITQSNTNTVTLADGNGLSLSGSWVGSQNRVLSLFWDGTNWVETSRR